MPAVQGGGACETAEACVQRAGTGLGSSKNLSDTRAQDLFISQFEQLIDTYNASRIWFDYNTAARQTHWNQHEAEDGQGLLELGFYRGLYAVFDRTLGTYPSVWIEGNLSTNPV